MNRSELVDAVVEKVGLKKHAVDAVIVTAIDVIKDTVINKQENVTLREFGTFVLQNKKARRYVSFDGKEHNVPDRRVFKFKTSRELNNSL